MGKPKLMFDRKGQIRIIEAFLSVAVIFSALLISVNFSTPPDLTGQKTLASLGTQALIKLDTGGILGELIIQGNWTAIKKSLDVSLPTGVSFNLTVYGENMLPINSQAIQNSNLLSREAVSVQYVCASQTATTQFFTLRLQLAWVR